MSRSEEQSRPKRMDGYVRVSRVAGRDGDSYISPTVQREAIERWAGYKGVTIAAWHVDEDWSGGTHERPGLEAAVERAVSGEVDGIVSWKIDRFSRYTEGGLRDLRRLEEAGAHLAFVSEDIDTSGPMGRFVYTIMLAMAEYFLANVKEAWATAKARAHKRGAKIGPTPFAYRRAADGLLEVHPEEAAILQEAYTRAATGDIGAAVTYLQNAAPEARTWTTLTVRRLLANRTYLGELRHGTLAPETFENLRVVSRATWEAGQTTPGGTRAPARHYPLSGLATCGQCRAVLVGGTGGKGQRTYRCRASLASYKGIRCSAPTTATAALLEDLVRNALLEEFSGVMVQRDVSAGDLALLETSLADAERELDDFLADASGASQLRRIGRYDAALTARIEAVTREQSRLGAAAAQSAEHLRISPQALLLANDPEGLARAARLVSIVVRRGRTPLAGRVTLDPLPRSAVAGAQQISP